MKNKVKINKQYGIINKEVIKDSRLSANAKGLYTYFCARAGNKGICNPSVDTICKDLHINVATFHKLKNELVNNKIINIEKKGTGINRRNSYILLKQTNTGYGMVYLDIVMNPRLNLKSKAIYGLLACYAGTRFIAYPLSKLIHSTLKISRNTYFNALRMLKELNFLITKQLHINGRFAHCNYYINGKEPNNKKIRFIFKGLKNNKLNTNIKKTNYTANINKNEDTVLKCYNTYKDNIISNIEYDALLGLFKDNKKALYILDNILTILTNDTYSENVKSIVVNDIKLSSSIIKSIFNKLNFDNIKYVIDNILKTNKKIKNIKKYIRVALVNSYYQLERKQYTQMRSF